MTPTVELHDGLGLRVEARLDGGRVHGRETSLGGLDRSAVHDDRREHGLGRVGGLTLGRETVVGGDEGVVREGDLGHPRIGIGARVDVPERSPVHDLARGRARERADRESGGAQHLRSLHRRVAVHLGAAVVGAVALVALAAVAAGKGVARDDGEGENDESLGDLGQHDVILPPTQRAGDVGGDETNSVFSRAKAQDEHNIIADFRDFVNLINLIVFPHIFAKLSFASRVAKKSTSQLSWRLTFVLKYAILLRSLAGSETVWEPVPV